MKSRLLTTIGPTVTEITLTCGDGIHLAAQLWKMETAMNHKLYDDNDDMVLPSTNNNSSKIRRILCLHGWMDNCRSFHIFAPSLLNQLHALSDDESVSTTTSATTTKATSTELVALDLTGHGWSDHQSLDAPPVLLSGSIYYIAEAVRQLQWLHTTESVDNNDSVTKTLPSFTLVGHSMGAAIGCIYAAAFPEQVQKLVLLEGAGPLARNAKDFAKQVRQSVQRRQLGSTKPPRIYTSLPQAVAARMETATKFPGEQYLSETAATELVLRGAIQVVPTTPSVDAIPAVSSAGDPVESATHTLLSTNGDNIGGWKFRHDPRLQWPSIQYCTNEQVEAIYTDIQCPVALLLAKHGWPFDSVRHQRTLELLQPTLIEALPGSHHFHADPDTADAVVNAVAHFLDAP